MTLADFADTSVSGRRQFRVSKSRVTKDWFDCQLDDFDDSENEPPEEQPDQGCTQNLYFISLYLFLP